MRKRLLAVFLACCMAASTASTVFAADDLPALTELPAVAAPADPDPPAAEEVVVETEVPDPTAEPAPETTGAPPDSAAEPTPEPVPTEAPAPEPTAETTPEPTAEPAPEPTEPPTLNPTAAPTQAPAGPEPTAAPTPQPTAEPLPTMTPAPTASPTPLPTASPVPQQTAENTEYAAVLAAPIPEPTAVPLIVDTLEVQDTISTDGCFTAVVNGSAERQDVTYTWYRSHDGQNWEQVTPRICTGSEWNITEGGEHKLKSPSIPASPMSALPSGCITKWKSPASTVLRRPKPVCPTICSCKTAALKARACTAWRWSIPGPACFPTHRRTKSRP